MDAIGYKRLINRGKFHPKWLLSLQHLLDRNILMSSTDENSIHFRSFFVLKCVILHLRLFLLWREILCLIIFDLSPLPADQSESCIGNVSPLRSYRLRLPATPLANAVNRYISSQEK